MSIASWFRERQIRKLNLHGAKDYPGWQDVKRIAIYYEVLPGYEAELRAWEKLFDEESKTLDLLAYQPVKRKNLDESWTQPSICKNDKNWWGKPVGEDYSGFVQHNYDVFIDLSRGKEAQHEIVARTVNASLKVAFKPAKAKWADLLIKCENGGLSEGCRKEVIALLKFVNAN